MPSTSRLVQAAPGPTPTSTAGDAGPHQLERRREADGVADDDGDVDLLEELVEAQALDAVRFVARGRDGALDDEDVDAGLLDERRRYFFVFIGVSETAATAPPSLISRMRWAMRSSRIGAW